MLARGKRKKRSTAQWVTYIALVREEVGGQGREFCTLRAMSVSLRRAIDPCVMSLHLLLESHPVEHMISVHEL